ncbi:MAG: hypothetical protein WEA04_04205, partial [Candidatus Andersenbacteria bacterium]
DNADLTNDTINLDKVADALALDANTSITQDGTETFTISNTGSGATIIDLTSTGDLEVRDAGVAFATFSDAGVLTLTNALAANGGITFDAATDTVGAFTASGTINMSTNILENIGNAGTDFIASTGGLTLAGALTANGAATFNTDVDATLAETENIAVTNSVSGTNAVDLLSATLTNSSTSGTQQLLVLDNAASTGTTDAMLVIDNSDTDTAVTAGIKFVNAGGGFTSVIDNAGTLISGTELNLLDGGVILSELTDSGTLTATTVDINGGAIDGTTIGATSASTGAFTTLSSTGATTLGNNSSTIAIDGTNIDVTTGGAVTLTGHLTLSGDANEGLSGGGLADCDTAATSKLLWDVTTNKFSCGTDQGASTLAWSALTAPTTNLALTHAEFTSAFTWDTAASSAAFDGFTMALTNDATTDGGNQRVLVLKNNDAAGTTGVTERFLVLDNADTDEAVTTALEILASSTGTITTALDISDAEIATALALGSNDVTVGGTTLSSAEVALLDAGITLGEVTDSGTLTATTVDINGGAIDGTTIGATSASTGAFTTLSSTGATAIGNNSATVAINSSDWDIDATGVITGVALDANGTGNSVSNIETGDIAAGTITGDNINANLAGNGLVLTAGTPDQLDLDFLGVADGAGATSSFSGMELAGASSDKLALLQGCTDGQLLEYTDAGGWACADDNTSAGAGVSTIQENDSTIDDAATTIDFLGADFVVTSSPAGEANVSIDYPNSGITRVGQNETVTGDWAFTMAGTESLNITSDLAGTVDIVSIIGTPSASAGTTQGLFIQQANHASNTNGLDAALVIDNADADLALTDAIVITNTGNLATGITTGLDFDDADIVTDIELQNGETIDNDTDGTVKVTAPIFTVAGTDPTIIFDESTATDTDFWAGNMSNNDGVDDDTFQFGEGTTPGSLPIMALSHQSHVGIGVTAPSTRLHVSNGTTTSDVLEIIRIGRTDTDSVGAAGLGSAIGFTLEDSSGATGQQAARLDVVWSDATNASEDATFDFNVMQAGTLVNVIDIGGVTGLSFVDTGLTTDISLQNGETIDNNTDGTILLTATTTDISGVLQAGSGNENLTLSTGKIDADALTLTAAVDGGTGTSSGSGLIARSDGIGLLQGCADGQILKWVESTDTWDCAADSTGGGSTTKFLNTQHNIASTTATEVTEISTGLTAGTYVFKYSLRVQSSATGTGLGFGINYTGTATSLVATEYHLGTGTAASTGTLDDTATGAGAEQIIEGAATRAESTTSPNLNVLTGVAAADVDNYVTIEGVIVVSDSGDLELWHNSEGAVTTRVMTGSSLIVTQITQGADLAEIYGTRDESIKAGDVVSLDSSMRAGVRKSDTPYDPTAFGIVSTSPGIVTGSLDDPAAMPVMVALAGRVPVKVTTENGPITAGDLLTSSSIPGVAMKATKAGQVIGQAMTDFTGEGVGSVKAFIKTDYSHGSTTADLLSWLNSTSRVETQTDDMGRLILSQFLEQQEQTAQSLNLSEIITDRLAAGLEIIAPRVTTQEITLESIHPLADEITLALGEDGKFVIANEATGEEAITFDNDGNATFAGTITADVIKARQIEGMEIFTNKLAELSEQVEGMTTMAPTQPSPEATAGAAILSTPSASPSATPSTSPSATPTITPESFEKNEQIVDLAVLEKLEISGALIVTGSAEFKGTVTFNNDTAGLARIKKGAQRVEVTFGKEYAAVPMVNANLTLDMPTGDNSEAAALELEERIAAAGYTHFVTRRTTKGFSIVLNKPAAEDLIFSWTALVVKSVKTHESNNVALPTEPILEATPSASPSPVIEASISPSPEPSLVPSATPSLDLPAGPTPTTPAI